MSLFLFGFGAPGAHLYRRHHHDRHHRPGADRRGVRAALCGVAHAAVHSEQLASAWSRSCGPPRARCPRASILALNGEAGFQADLLRGGIHFGLLAVAVPRASVPAGHRAAGQDRLRLCPRRPAAAAEPDARPRRGVQQLPGRAGVPRRAELPTTRRKPSRGQRGRQLAILREGVYAINPALFVVITEDAVYTLRQLADAARAGDGPLVAGGAERDRRLCAGRHRRAGARRSIRCIPEETMLVDSIGIVTVHDGPSLAPGEIIAPAVGSDVGDGHYHNNFQDPQRFLDGGGRRGRQYQPLTDGTYFINRWFATVELIPKTVVPIGYVGVVVSYYGQAGDDLSGDRVSPRRARRRRAARRLGAAVLGRASMRSTPMPATSCWCRRRTSCCTGSRAAARRIATTIRCGRSTW